MFITENGEYYRVRIAHEFNYSYDNNNAAIPLLVPLIMRFNFICQDLGRVRIPTPPLMRYSMMSKEWST